MKNFIIYNSDGTIIRTGTVSRDDDFSLQVQEGEFIMEGVADGSTQKIEDGAIVDFVIPSEEITAALIVEKRQERDQILLWCDWTQGADSPLSDSKKAEWATYRQALRDITSHSNWPDLEEEDWPTEPS